MQALQLGAKPELCCESHHQILKPLECCWMVSSSSWMPDGEVRGAQVLQLLPGALKPGMRISTGSKNTVKFAPA